MALTGDSGLQVPSPLGIDHPNNFNPMAKLTSSRVSDFSQQQLANAAIIVSVGRSMGLTTRDIQIGLITAMVESNLINVDYGDRDSLGLFQQRPSQGWGTAQQVMDPQYAARKFFTTLIGLGDRRYQMGMGEAAQAVQRSAYPERYAQRISTMRSLWPDIQKSAGEQPQSIEGTPYMDSPYVGNYITGEDYAAGLEGSGPAAIDALAGNGPLERALTDVETPEPLTPSAEQMLGAWGMSNPAVQQPEADPFLGAGPIISPATNASVITPLSQETGDFAKGVDGWRKAVLAAARTALGTPYTWGGNSLQGGVDCSGLVQQAFARAGLTMPRVSYQQATRGARVGLDALRPGDLVAWNNSSRNSGADHIAIYLGNGQIIEAARPGTAVRIRTVDSDEGAYGVQLNF
jgi:cell wall-associated NlpC family hydrolase